jgi:hypothetical protein
MALPPLDVGAENETTRLALPGSTAMFSGAPGTVRGVAETVALGFDTIKLKIGYADVAQDRAVLAAAQKAGDGKLKLLVPISERLKGPSLACREVHTLL